MELELEPETELDSEIADAYEELTEMALAEAKDGKAELSIPNKVDLPSYPGYELQGDEPGMVMEHIKAYADARGWSVTATGASAEGLSLTLENSNDFGLVNF